MLSFPGNTLPGIYGAGAFQTLVNRDLIKSSEKVLIVGGGNVGLIAGYHAIQAGTEVVGVDWRTPLDTATRRIGPDKAVQGNLDPCVLFAPWPVVEAEVRRILDEGRAAPGHVFNLGHGVLPETDPDVLTRVVALVHELSARPVE